ncbi:hypothetical protein PIB30_071234 [Stylosanthes scabra]|uniref:Uncharacterized protein n=1 Tax=Stylosanthes scabra TaxID=79078 RepID=A0ABU6SPW2_9FABA|nr:hypothetical protein [Stylosanthes scabra]
MMLTTSTMNEGSAIGSAEVLHDGAVTMREGESRVMNHHGAVESSSGEVLQRGWHHRASPIAAKPPVLMAAVLPWDRLDEIGTEKWNQVAVEGVVRAIVGAIVGDRGGRAVTMRDANANLVQEYVQSGCVTKGEEMMIGTPISSSDKKPKD